MKILRSSNNAAIFLDPQFPRTDLRTQATGSDTLGGSVHLARINESHFENCEARFHSA